ncbi:MAG: outer membrane lipoprotein carrier protein LolA [Acidobacteria bacterium]|nr:outer membrane lipoprotein carrier protein LolA [Acidobacteriota bacterium]
MAISLDGRAASVTQAVEERYNRLKSLQVGFSESVSYNGRGVLRARRQERGTLYLQRPRKMRWEYTKPAGKLFVSDGKMFYLYSPNSNQVQRIPPKQAEDLRAPLAFLLGKLDFQKEFGQIVTRASEAGIELTAAARTPQDPFTDTVFTIDPRTFEIRRIVVNGQDGLVTEFQFSGETVNPSLEARLFVFQAPPGAEIVEAGR